MIKESFYLSDESNLERALELTGLSLDELSGITGKFNKNSGRAGQMRGEIIVKFTGEVIVRHHFTKKVLWSGELAPCLENLDERL